MSSRSDELRQQAKEAGQRADQSKALSEAATERKRQRGLAQLADNEDWLEGKMNGEPLTPTSEMGSPSERADEERTSK